MWTDSKHAAFTARGIVVASLCLMLGVIVQNRILAAQVRSAHALTERAVEQSRAFYENAHWCCARADEATSMLHESLAQTRASLTLIDVYTALGSAEHEQPTP